jgi:putative transposase
VIAGFRVGFEAPSILLTALTLRQAIWRKRDARWDVCGIPDTFYTDHGSDFTSNHLEQVAAELRMQLVFSELGMLRGRGRIERFFGPSISSVSVRSRATRHRRHPAPGRC